MTIQIRSSYDEKLIKCFQWYQSGRIAILGYVFGIILFVFGILLGILSIRFFQIYIIMGLMLPIICYFRYARRENKTLLYKVSSSEPIIQIFNFTEEEILLEQISIAETLKDKYFYSEILSVIKYKNCYFLYVSVDQALVLYNEDYIIGDEEELDGLFKKIKGDKFIVKRNSRRKRHIKNEG